MPDAHDLTASHPAPLAVDAEQIGHGILPISKRTWWGWVNSGRAPGGFKVGNRRMWDVSQLRRWIAAGCPRREEFELLDKGANQ